MHDALLAERRDHAIDRLSTQFAHGDLELDELEHRLALVHAARSAAEVEALAPATTTALVPAKRVRVVLGSIERAGAWVVPQHLAARVVLGNLTLDLREAQLAPGVTTIEVSVTLGNVEVIVPPGVAVEVEATSVLGNVEERVEPAVGGRASVRVVGKVKLGNLELSTRRPGECVHGRRERRWSRAKLRRRALPAPWD